MPLVIAAALFLVALWLVCTARKPRIARAVLTVNGVHAMSIPVTLGQTVPVRYELLDAEDNILPFPQGATATFEVADPTVGGIVQTVPTGADFTGERPASTTISAKMTIGGVEWPASIGVDVVLPIARARLVVNGVSE